MASIRVVEEGSGRRVVLVHGSVTNSSTWHAQRPLAARCRLVVPDRPGYPPNPPLPAIDFEEQARELVPLLGHRAHLVGHSYGGVIALLAAAAAPDRVWSLTVIEPPCFAVARGQPAVEEVVERVAAVRASARDPLDYLHRFLRAVGAPAPAGEVSRELELGAGAAMVERPPWEADVPLRALAECGFPVLVASGAHSAAFDAVCDVLERELAAERLVLPGYGHGVHRHPEFNERLELFLDRAERSGGAPP